MMKKVLTGLAVFGFIASAQANNYAPKMKGGELPSFENRINSNGGLDACYDNGGIAQTSKWFDINNNVTRPGAPKKYKANWSSYKGKNCYGKVTKQKVKEDGADKYRLFFKEYSCGSVAIGYEKDRYGDYVGTSKGKVRGYKLGSYKKSNAPKAITLNDKAVSGDKDTKLVLSNGSGAKSMECIIMDVKFR